MALGKRCRYAYRAAAVLLLNGLLAFASANAMLALLARARRAWMAPREDLGRMVASHGLDVVAQAYPGWRREDLVALLRRTQGAFAIEYEPFTSYRPSARRDRFLNVSPAGYRLVQNQGPWPPNPRSCNVFVFGGSTTFGVGLPDEQTIPSRLGEQLSQSRLEPVYVYNFGRPGYLCVQERLLLARLLSENAAPRLAVFIDGLNEFYVSPRPLTADVMRDALAATTRAPAFASLAAAWLAELPIARLTRTWMARASLLTPPGTAAVRPPPARVVAEWLANKRAIDALAAEFGAATLHVWQPVPWVRYDLAHHLFEASVRVHAPPGIEEGYALVERWRRTPEAAASFLWLADLQSERDENLYVTETHYGPAFAAEIAQRIARRIDEGGLLECRLRER